TVAAEAAACSGPLINSALRAVEGPEMRRRMGTCWPRTVAEPSHVPSIAAGLEARAKTEEASRTSAAKGFLERAFMEGARFFQVLFQERWSRERRLGLKRATRLCAGQRGAAATT